MAYYLIAGKRREEFKEIDITQTKYFSRTSNYKGVGMSLLEVDMFTMMFNDENELRKALFKEGLIQMRNFSTPLSIRNKRNGNYDKVMYDFLYQKDMEYIANPKLLIDRINDKFISGDYRFVEALANNYSNFYECKSTAAELREFASRCIRQESEANMYDTIDENGDNLLTRMIKLLIYEHYQLESGKVVYKDKVAYRNLHSLLAFTNHYDKKIKESEVKDTKKKTLKKEIDGQITFF